MSDRIHVLHVLNSAHGGSALSTFQVIDALKQFGVQSSLVCYNNASPGQLEKINALVSGRVLFIPLYWSNKRTRVKWWKRPLLEMLTLWQTWKGHRYQKEIAAFIRRHHIQIIHTSTIVNPEGAIAARRNTLPHIWHVRELIGSHTYYSFPRFRHWIRFVSSHASVLLANSTVTAANLANYFSKTQIRYIPNGIDLSEYDVKVHSERKKLIIAMVGNVTSRLKNHEFFIRTAAHFRANTNVRFLIFGALPSSGDPYYASLARLVQQLDLKQTVAFMGHHDHVPGMMKQIDILFHPTGHESFGRIFIEAMAAGIPLIGVDEGGAKELVRNDINGFRVSENDDQAAAGQIGKLIQSVSLRATFGKNGRAIVEAEYTLNSVAKKVSDLYSDFVKSKG